jgi:hypothetical protein
MESLKSLGSTTGVEEDYFGLLPFDTEQLEKFGTYSYLWISEKLLIQGMCQFLAIQAAIPQRSQLQTLTTNTGSVCVFNVILQLDFSKSKLALDDHLERVKSLEHEHKEDSKAGDFVFKVEDRVNKVTNFLKLMTRAAEYAKQARA